MMTVEEMEARVAQLGYTLNTPTIREIWGCGDPQCCGPSFEVCTVTIKELPDSYGHGYDYEEALADLLYILENFHEPKDN